MILDYTSPYFNSLALDSAQARTIQTLIQGAQSFVEKFCHREFESKEHDRVYQVRQDGSIILQNHPISAIYRICFISQSFFSLTNSNAIGTYSTSTDGIALRTFNSGWKNTIIEYGDKTAGELATAINSYGNGWTAVCDSQFANFPASDLVSDQAGTCNRSVAQVWAWSDYNGQYSFDNKTGVIYGIFNSWGYGNGTSDAWNEFTYYGGFGAFAASWGYYGGFFSRGKNVRIVYQGGFETPPAEIKQCIADLVITAFNGPEGRIKSESLGDYQYSLMDFDELPMSDKKIMSLYKDRLV